MPGRGPGKNNYTPDEKKQRASQASKDYRARNKARKQWTQRLVALSRQLGDVSRRETVIKSIQALLEEEPKVVRGDSAAPAKGKAAASAPPAGKDGGPAYIALPPATNPPPAMALDSSDMVSPSVGWAMQEDKAL